MTEEDKEDKEDKEVRTPITHSGWIPTQQNLDPNNAEKPRWFNTLIEKKSLSLPFSIHELA